jgi:halocyanin-like protein
MMSDDSNTRRRFLQATGAAATLAIAGCSGGGGGDTTTESGGGETTESGGGETTESGGEETTEGGSMTTEGGSMTTEGGSMTTEGGSMTTESGSMEVPQEVSDYLSDTSNFDGSLEDMTGQDSVTVEVGAEGNNGNFAYAPAAIVVDSGTTVTWEWTGQGGQHNVVAESGGDFESELVGQEGTTFEQTFDSTGVVTYFCTPHKSLGMKGAVIVA